MTWEEFAALPPGTTFVSPSLIDCGCDSCLAAGLVLVKVAPAPSLEIYDSFLFNVSTGTLHHGSEYIDFQAANHGWVIYPPGKYHL